MDVVATFENCQNAKQPFFKSRDENPTSATLGNLDVNFNSPGHCSSRDGSFIQDEDMHLILEFGPRKTSVLSAVEECTPAMVTSSWRCRNAEWANNFDADIAQLDFDDFSAVRDMAPLRGGRYKVEFGNGTGGIGNADLTNFDPQDVVDALTAARRQQQMERKRNRQKRINNRRLMKNSMEVSLFELSEDGSSLFSSEECYATNGNEEDEDEADVEEYSDKLIGDELTFDQQRLVAGHVPAFISTDSLDYSSLSIGEEQLRAACATNKHDYVLTFDKNAFENGLAILSTLDVDNDKNMNENNKVFHKRDENLKDFPTNFGQLKENKDPDDFNNANVIPHHCTHPFPSTDQDNIDDNEDNDELMTWERVKRSYEMPPNENSNLYNLPNSKCTSLPNLQPTLAHPQIRKGAEEKMVSQEMCHHINNNSDENYENFIHNNQNNAQKMDPTETTAPFSLLKAFQQQNEHLSHVIKQANQMTPANHVTISNESSGYVTGTGGSQIVGNAYYNNNNFNNHNFINNFGTNFNNCTKFDSNEIINFNLHQNMSQNMNKIINNNSINDKNMDDNLTLTNKNHIDECTNQIFQQLMNNRNLVKSKIDNNTNDDQDYEYAEFFINGRYIDMNHNEIGFVPPPENQGVAQNDHVTDQKSPQKVENQQNRGENELKNTQNCPNFGFQPINNGRRCWQTQNFYNRAEIPPAKPPRTFATLIEQNNEDNFSTEIIDNFAQNRKNQYFNQQNHNYNDNYDSRVNYPRGQYGYTANYGGYAANSPSKDSATQIPVYVADQSVQTVLPDSGRLVTVINQSSSDWSDSIGQISPTNQNHRHRLPDLSFLRFPFKVPPLDLSLSPFLMNFLGESPQTPPPPLLSRDFSKSGVNTNNFVSNLMKLTNFNNIFNCSNSQLLQPLPSPPLPKLATTQKAALNNAAFSGSRDFPTPRDPGPGGGPSHVQDWDSLATLLPKDVVQACLFFKENTNYLRNIDKPAPASSSLCLNPDRERKFHYFPSCKRAASTKCRCKSQTNNRRCGRIDESEEFIGRDHVTGFPIGPGGHFYYCCYHCGGASIAANAGCFTTWCHPRFKEMIQRDHVTCLHAGSAAHACGYNNAGHFLARCQQHCDNNTSACCCCSTHSDPVCRLVGSQSRDLLSRHMSQSTFCSLPSDRTQCMCQQKMPKNIGERSKSKLKDNKNDFDAKDEMEFGNSVKSLTVLIEKITRYCSDVVEAFAQSANKADGYNLNAVVGAVLFDSLCPAVENLVADGLSTGKTVLNIVQTSFIADFAAQSVCSLVIGLNGTEGKRRENSLQFAVFINSLLNLHSLDTWLTDLIHNDSLLLENYAPVAFLRIIGSKRCVNLYDSMMGAVKRLTFLPFDRLKLIDVQISFSNGNEQEEENGEQKIDNNLKNLDLTHCALYARTPSSETDDPDRKGFSCTVALQKELRIIFRFPSSYTASAFFGATSDIKNVEKLGKKSAEKSSESAKKSSNSTEKPSESPKKPSGFVKKSSEFIFEAVPFKPTEPVPAKLASDSRIPTNSSSVLAKFKNSFEYEKNEKVEKMEENEAKIGKTPEKNDNIGKIEATFSKPKSISVDNALKKSTKTTVTPMTPPQTPKKSRIPLPRSANSRPKSDVCPKNNE